ncbi:RNA polymerase sigma factor [Agathobacter rectalis]|uniref:RNA polymerase sigma factor n=1 Tax=Agathobacter rectalis TaxID=39491 RepID=UPI003D65AE58
MLVKYEFLKILRKKSTLIIMAVSLILTAFLFGLPIIQFQTYNQEGVMKGFEGIEYQKTQYEDISVSLTNEYIAGAIREVQELFENSDNVGYDGYEQFLIDDAYWDGIAPRESLLNLIAKNYSNPNESVSYNTLVDLDVSNGTDFYQARQEKIEKLLNDSSRKLTEEQKSYWLDMNSKVEEPFQYGYYKSWETIISCFELLMFSLLAVCIVIAPVFSGEYQAGTDAVILSAKYGKTKLTTAKSVASYLFGFAAFTLHIIVAFGLGVNEDDIEKLRVHDWAIFNSDRRYYQRVQETGTYLDELAEDTTQPEVKTVEDFLDSIENQHLYQVLIKVDRLTLQIALMKVQGYSTREIAVYLDITEKAVYRRMDRLKEKLKKFFE